MNIKEHYNQLCDIVCEITGITEAQLMVSRVFPIAYYRAIVAYELHRKGYCYQQIGHVMGRSHSTISVMCRRLNDSIDLTQYQQVKDVQTKLKQRIYAQKSIQ